jgi:hypothetical protein
MSGLCNFEKKKQGHSCFQYHNNYNKFTIYYHKSCPVSVFLKNRSKKMAGHEREEYGIYNSFIPFIN